MPCSYCSRLLYPNQIKWITRQTNSIFPFEHVYPHIPLNTHPRNSTKVAVCPHVNYHLTHVSKTYLMGKRKYLSPIYLHSSLGRSSNVPAYSEYRSIKGQFGYSKNLRTLSLYSGMLGAFLQNIDLSSPENLR